jgi:hypothetical protein
LRNIELPACYAVSTGQQSPTFRNNQMPSFSKSLGTFVNSLFTTRHNGSSNNISILNDFLFSRASRPALESSTVLSGWHGRLFYGGGGGGRVKHKGNENYDSPPCSTNFKNVWWYVSNLPYVFMVRCLFKRKDNFISA